MGLSYGQITRWRAHDAELLADAMSARTLALEMIEDDLRSARQWGDAWSGSDGEHVATISISALGDEVTDLAAEATAIRRVASHVANALEALHEEILSLQAYAEKYHYSISDDGVVIDRAPGVSFSEDEENLREVARRDLAQSVSEIVAKGRVVEQDAANGLSVVNSGGISDGGATSVDQAERSQMGLSEPPPPGTDPIRVNVWWESLSDDEKYQVKHLRSDEIRNLAGIDSHTRDQLNREALHADQGPAENARTAAQNNLDDFLAEHRWDERGYLNSAPGSAYLRSQRDRLEAELEGAERHVEELSRLEQSLLIEDSRLLEYDNSTPQLQAILAVGDPDTADNVAVTTPGYTTNVHDSIAGMSTEAEMLRDTAADIDSTKDTAAIAFIGYQAPQDAMTHSDFRILTPGAAYEGATPLAASIQGIAATNSNADLNLSLFGHSYGSTTAGIAAQYAANGTVTPIDSLAVYGSPGIPEVEPHKTTLDAARGAILETRMLNPNPNPDLASMGLDSSRAYYMENEGDAVSGPIGAVGERTRFGMGNSPERWDMTRLSTETTHVTYPNGATELRLGVDDLNKELRMRDPHHSDIGPHSAFPKDRTTSQFNLAAIAAGRPELAPR